MRIELILVGDELLRGDVIDRHVAFLAQRLAAFGAGIARSATVGDAAAEIRAAVESAWARSTVVLVTGGLGPTTDDRTREVVAELFDRPLTEDPEQLAWIRGRFARLDVPMPDSARRQAAVPDGFERLANPVGTAPGLAWEPEGRAIYLLPGPPHELAAVFTGEVEPRLRQAVLAVGAPACGAALLLAGVPESTVQEEVGGLVAANEGVGVSYRADAGEVWVRFSGVGDVRDRVDAVRDAAESRFGTHVVGREGASLAAAVGASLTARGWRMATAESCTGGGIGARLTSEAGSSAWYVGGVVSYSNELKQDLLGVGPAVIEEHGAVSEPVARAMADGIRERTGAEVGLSVTGIAGPGGERPGKPVGLTWLAASVPGEVRVERWRFGGDRETNRRYAVTRALDLARRIVIGAGPAIGGESR